MDDLKSIIEAARTGDTEAFNALVARFGSFAHARAFAWLGDHHRAEEVVQEAFLEVALKLHQLQSPHAFTAWFKRILLKHCDRVTRKKSLPEVALTEALNIADDAPKPDGGAALKNVQSAVQQGLAQLTGAQQDLIRAAYFRQRPQKDIARDLGVPLTTVKKRLHDARRKLATVIAQAGVNAEDTESGQAAFPVETQIFMAAWHGRRARLQRLLSDRPELLQARNDEGLSLLLFAAHAAHYSGRHDITAWLLGAGALPDIHAAAALGEKTAVRRALPVAGVDLAGPWGRTALHWAVCGGHRSLAARLLDRGADPNRPDHWGCTAVHLAADFGHKELLDLLIARGGDPARVMDNGKNLLHLAASRGDRELIDRVRHAGLRLDIFTAAALGHLGLADRLIHANPAAINQQLRIGATPLQLAAERGHAAMIDFLQSRGARIDPISAIAMNDECALFEMLERQPRAIDRNAGSFGFTPLHAASIRGRDDLVQHLLAQGADVNRSDRMFRKTPMEEALFFGKESAARLLRRHGGRLASH